MVFTYGEAGKVQGRENHNNFAFDHCIKSAKISSIQDEIQAQATRQLEPQAEAIPVISYPMGTAPAKAEEA